MAEFTLPLDIETLEIKKQFIDNKGNIIFKVNWSEHVDLMTMGIDEISNRKGHQDYLTIIRVKNKFDETMVVAVLEGRKKRGCESIPGFHSRAS